MIRWGSRLKILFLKKLRVTSNASRNIRKPELLYPLPFFFSKLALSPLSRSGKGHSGRILCYTKKSYKIKHRIPHLNYSFYPVFLSFIVNFYLNPKPQKLLSLVATLDGGFTFLQLADKHQLFNYLYDQRAALRLPKLFPSPDFSQLRFLPNTAKVSSLNLGLGGKAVFARSPGTYATILKFNIFDHTVNLELPSGAHKTFSVYATALLSPAAFGDKRLSTNTKSGFWRNRGFKSKVRGVARNPIDHPHGGRTKAIRYPRTPWGKTTKFK